MSSSHQNVEPAFVILVPRYFHQPGTALETLITAKAIVRSREVAELEVARLDALHPDGQVRYWVAASRLFLTERPLALMCARLTC